MVPGSGACDSAVVVSSWKLFGSRSPNPHHDLYESRIPTAPLHLLRNTLPKSKHAPKRQQRPEQGQVGRGGARRAAAGRGKVAQCTWPPTVLTLQILADPFETRFNPFTLEHPRVRMPPKIASCTLTLASVSYPSRIPRSSVHVRISRQRRRRGSLCILRRTQRAG